MLEKALLPILVTEFGIVNVPVNPVQLWKALFPIVVTEDGIVNEPVNPVQFWKAWFPILVILFKFSKCTYFK